jgi:hypothetical protein
MAQAGDAENGNQVGPDAKNGIGPTLNGVVGSKAGTVAGFVYSGRGAYRLNRFSSVQTNPFTPACMLLMDAGYGASTELRWGIPALDLIYVAGILPNKSVWEEGEEPLL